jgi:superfamily I DNA/RNA helicase
MNLPRISGWTEFEIAGAVCRALNAFCASADPEFVKSHGRAAIIAKTGDPELMFDKIRKREAQGVIEMLAAPIAKMARRYWKQLVKEEKFSHDMYLKMADLNDAMRTQAFLGHRYLMIDEAQDLNPVQRSILEKTGLPLIAVGDSYQQIYAWRGAENALDLLPGRKLHLTQSFRFGEDIAARAREILDTYPDGPPEKRLIGAGTGAKTGHTGAMAAVICRTNIGMLEEAIRLMRRGVTIHVDNMGGLLEDVMSAAALRSGDVRKVRSDLIKPFGSWGEMEAEADAGDATLSKLINIVERNMVDDVRKLDDTHMRNPDGAKAVICTAHRSKGLEFPVVQLGDDWNTITDMKARLAKSEKLSAKQRTIAVGEWNALYVAATRAMNRLSGLDRIMYPEDPDAEADAGRETRVQAELER